MSFKVFLTETFQKCIKVLKKKYPHIKEDLLETIQSLEKDPAQGKQIPGWQGNIWKIRSRSSDLQKGKGGGFRVIYRWKKTDKEIYLLTIYFKIEKTDVSRTEIEELLKKLNAELNV